MTLVPMLYVHIWSCVDLHSKHTIYGYILLVPHRGIPLNHMYYHVLPHNMTSLFSQTLLSF